MILRPYQEDLVVRAMDSLRTNKSCLVQLPTGGGKTVVFVSIIDKYVKQGKRVLVLVHRKELITQAAAKLFKMGINHGFILAGAESAYSRPVQLASVQTIIRRNMPKNIDCIITDECHHATANSYKTVYEAYPEAHNLGFTATPCRTNGQGFGDIFKDIQCGPSVKELIKEGYLVEPTIYSAPLHMQLNKVKVTGGDYNDGELAKLLDNAKYVRNIVREWRKKAEGKKTIVFAITVEHSKHIVAQYNSEGIKAAHIDGTTPDDVRSQILKDFALGKYTILSNVGIVTEGFDVPEVECVQLTRPTKSLALYLQMVGRGLRPAQGKSKTIILDHANAVFEHGFPQTDRQWTLSGVKKRQSGSSDVEMKVMARTKDGQLFNIYDLPREIDDIELIEVPYSDIRVSQISELIRQAELYGQKPASAYYKFCSKYGKPSVYELNYFQQQLKLKTGWLYHKKIEHGYIPAPPNYHQSQEANNGKTN